MALAPEQTRIGIRRHFTDAGTHPYDTVQWERRDARITNFRDGTVAFEQTDVEFPTTWSLNATNIVAQKYFRGSLGTSEREWSLRQVIDRVADTITAWGARDGYFVDDDEADTFNAELKYLLVHQKVAFNSPVWFNIGVQGVPQQASACFILSVDDKMDSILNWYVEEGTIFKGGSGAGINLSRIRSSHELLKGGGTASGPVSFMRGADASAGTIKSGGKTRRAAKMVILDVDHPDVEEFIWCKAREEQKARVLRDAGFDMDLDGADSHSTQYQNANNSVRVTDEFMQAVVDDVDWHLRAVTDGSIIKTVRAKELMRQISQATWECADPGMQFDTTINHWHTAANTGRINGSNPCFPGDALVHTDKGLVSFEDLVDRTRLGETFGVYTHDATNVDEPAQRIELTTPDAVMITGRNEIVRLRFSNGAELRCTPGHRIFTVNRGWVEAQDLTADDRVKALDLPTPAMAADWRLPVSAEARDYATADVRTLKGVHLPEKWSSELGHYLGWLVGDGCMSADVASTVYGTDEEREHVLPRHRALAAEINDGFEAKPSVQANGTVQLRQSRKVIARFLEALGVSTGHAPRQGRAVGDPGGTDGGRARPSCGACSTLTAACVITTSPATSGSGRPPKGCCRVSSACSARSGSSAGSTRRVPSRPSPPSPTPPWTAPRPSTSRRRCSTCASPAGRSRRSPPRSASTTRPRRPSWPPRSAGTPGTARMRPCASPIAPTTVSSSPTTCPSPATTPMSSTASWSGTARSTCTWTTRRATWPASTC